MTDWGDLVARAGGLGGRLLNASQWRGLCSAPDLPALATQLSALGVVGASRAEASTSAGALELAVRRRAASRLRLLARWAGPRAVAIAPLYDDEDRQSLRAIVRGTVGGVEPGRRSSGLLATPALPLGALAQLARAPDLRSVAALLATWSHPFAPAVADEAQRAHPDLFRIDVALSRVFAARALGNARRADPAMRLFVGRTIDIENAWAALVLTGNPRGDVNPDDVFVEGGTVLSSGDWRAAMAAQSPIGAAAHLRTRLAGTPLAAALQAEPLAREERMLTALIAEFKQMSRRQPLSTAPIIHFVLRQRREVRVVQRVIWGIALGAPAAFVAGTLGEAA